MTPPVKTTCAYCGVGCGVIATPDGLGGASIAGDRDHPANFGRLCSKGAALGETLDLEGRLLAPQIAGRSVGWDTAIAKVAAEFSAAIEEFGPDSVAFYVSGQLLTEDYYVANKVMKGYIGSANIDTNSRLCMASSVAGHKRAFGTDTVPGTYEDLELADQIVLVGSNLAWCHPVLHQRILAAKAERDLRIITVDPRRTATADLADHHFGIAPGGDVALFNGLLRKIAKQGAVDAGYVAEHVTGFDEAVATARISLEDRMRLTGLSEEELILFDRLWIERPKTVTVYSQGVNQASDGSDKVNAIINCHLATGRIGTPGCGPFSVTGQPNAMGGREVGGLANMLAGHLDIENADHRAAVQQFWGSPKIPEAQGLKAVDLFQACHDGKIKALWIMCTNPAVSLPRADHVADAIRKVPFVAVSDIMADTDTTRLADVLLPATGWGEKDGTVTNSERRISRQRAFLPVPGDARHDWQMICDVAQAMGFDGFGFDNPAAIFDEWARMTDLSVGFGKDVDLRALAGLDQAAFDALTPVQWPVKHDQSDTRFFSDGGYFTPDGKAKMLPIAPRGTENMPSDRAPLVLNTGRVRDHWHTLTRTGKAETLNQHISEPYLEVHPQDAHALELLPAGLATVESPYGHAVLRVQVTTRVQPGSVFAPLHWTGPFSSDGRIDTTVAPILDPVSGQPELKRSPVRVRGFDAAWYGFAALCDEPAPTSDYWAKAKAKMGWRVELAETEMPADLEAYAKALGARGEVA
ncbi:MAG: nitrate reductase, partial [Pseudomonadota bacterium]